MGGLILEADTVVFVLSPSDVAAGLIEARNARDTMSINAGSIPHAESAVELVGKREVVARIDRKTFSLSADHLR